MFSNYRDDVEDLYFVDLGECGEYLGHSRAQHQYSGSRSCLLSPQSLYLRA